MPRRTNTRERLIATASELFRHQGYAQTGVNEIMRRAGTTSGSFYHFFPTKDDLLMAVVDSVEEVLDTQIFGEAESKPDPVGRVFAVLAAHRRYLERNDSALGSPLGNLAAEISESHPGVRRRIAELHEGWIDRMERLLDGAADNLPRDLDRRELAEFMLSTVEGASLRARVNRGLAPYDASIAVFRRLFADIGSPSPAATRIEQRPPAPQRPASTPSDWRAW